MAARPFQFKRFRVEQTGAAHPAGTDGVLLGSWAEVREPEAILDIGTGTGLIALFLAQRSENQTVRKIVGLDIHAASSICAAQNFQASPWAQKLISKHLSLREFCTETSIRFDLIVSNPPYFSNGIPAPDLDRRLGRMATTLRLETLLESVYALLAPAGIFCTILPPLEGHRLCELAACSGLYCTRMTAVHAWNGKPLERLLLQFESKPYRFERQQIAIFKEPKIYSDTFKRLTAAFYLDF
jgi:tRNA1Val (adenine37-N6)-methyltransferase